MGTRADFYAGKGTDAEWIGSIAYDGFREKVPDTILRAEDEAAYRVAVLTLLASRSDATFAADGWPWPWDDSATTDCSYWFFDNETHDAWGCASSDDGLPDRMVPCRLTPDWEDAGEMAEFEEVQYPDMSAVRNVAFGERAGFMLLARVVGY